MSIVCGISVSANITWCYISSVSSIICKDTACGVLCVITIYYSYVVIVHISLMIPTLFPTKVVMITCGVVSAGTLRNVLTARVGAPGRFQFLMVEALIVHRQWIVPQRVLPLLMAQVLMVAKQHFVQVTLPQSVLPAG